MLKVINGYVYDPVQGLNGQKKDLWIDNGTIIEAPEEKSQGCQVIDAADMIVMPGGVDIHSHIAGPKIYSARLLRPEEYRRYYDLKKRTLQESTAVAVPTISLTGFLYTKMGYTTVMEAAVPPIMARHAHMDLNDIPVIDKGCFILMGNNRYIFDLISRKQKGQLKDFVAWLLHNTGGYAIKIVDPGGVDSWKGQKVICSLDDLLEGFNISPRHILASLAEASDELGLPHGIHVHCNNLGMPGNILTTEETITAVSGRRLHLAHVQFHCYGGTSVDNWNSAAYRLIELLEKNSNVTVDVGQIMFGETTALSADGRLQYELHRASGCKWMNKDIEMETGSGLLPLSYSEKNWINVMQWAAGLELLLSATNPWQLFLTTDHPNGCSFVNYPLIIQLLMDKGFRRQVMQKLNKKGLKRTALLDIDREYSLNDIVVITRSGPAKALGLKRKGHLQVGADADIAIYRKANGRVDFSKAYYVIKSGKMVVKEGEIIDRFPGVTYMVKPRYDENITEVIRAYYKKYSTISAANYAVQDNYYKAKEVIPCT
ncbi:MAG: formylmethanofuran dehydrogenase subunit A [Bacillota bacterium]